MAFENEEREQLSHKIISKLLFWLGKNIAFSLPFLLLISCKVHIVLHHSKSHKRLTIRGLQQINYSRFREQNWSHLKSCIPAEWASLYCMREEKGKHFFFFSSKLHLFQHLVGLSQEQLSPLLHIFVCVTRIRLLLSFLTSHFINFVISLLNPSYSEVKLTCSVVKNLCSCNTMYVVES